MKKCEDRSVFDWISKGCLPQSELPGSDPAWTGTTVHNLLPVAFEAYAKIFHRLVANYQWIDKPLSDEDVKILKIPQCKPLRSLIESLRMKEVPARIRWKDVATALGLPFASQLSDEWFRSRLEPGCWPLFVCGPDEGFLESDEYAELATLLTHGEYSAVCFFRLPEIPFVATDQELLFTGTAEEVTGIPTNTNWKTPEYWWPRSHEWCVCSDFDLSYTVVGGSRETVSSIIASSLLEAIEVNPDTRVDYRAPLPI